MPFKKIGNEIFQSIFWVAHRNAFDITFFTTALGIVVLFIPLGIFLPALFQVNSLKKAIIYSVTAGVFIEIVQFLTGTGILNVNDLLFYASGSALGWLIYSSIRKFNIPSLRKVQA
ncbi:VanZ family protein [Paenibacillus sp. P25]|nr:VanZ family protein [Paenibacillus sp. P25]